MTIEAQGCGHDHLEGHYCGEEESYMSECSREYQDSPCEGELFVRTSRTGLTQSVVCEGHAMELERSLDQVAERYPEVNHSLGCHCWGCSEGSY